MTVNCSPFGPLPQFELSSGQPAVGNQLFFYVAGSVNTKQNTYTDSTGLVANSNPLVLNALGQPANQIWFTAGAGYKVVFAPAGDTDPPSSPIWTIDNLRGINDTTTTNTEWLSGPAPTFIGATSFSIVGDQRTTFQINRRLLTTNTSGTIYSSITNSTYDGSKTTVTVTNDSSSLDSGLSAVSYALLGATNPSVPAQYLKPDSSGTVNITKSVAGTYFTGMRITNSDATGFARLILTANGTDGELGWAPGTGLIFTSPGTDPVLLRVNGTARLSATTTGATVTGTANATTGYQFNGTALPYQTEYNSGQQTITAAGALTLTHGLAAQPTKFSAYLVNVTADLGYTTGQTVPLGSLGNCSTTAGNSGVSIIPTATQLLVRFGSTAGAFNILNAGSGASGAITPANWKIVFLAGYP